MKGRIMENEIMKRNRTIYSEYKAGSTKASLTRKYSLSITTIDNIIRQQEWFKQNGATEWIYQMSHRTAVWLLRNGIKTQEDLYEKVDTGKYLNSWNAGKECIAELNNYIDQEVRISKTDGMRKMLSFGKDVVPEQKKRHINGTFKGTINGQFVEGEIEGEYISAASVRAKLA